MGDLDYIAALLHGRRGSMAAGSRLAGLCGLGSVPALAEALFPGSGLVAAAGLRSRLEQAYMAEAEELSTALAGARGLFIDWQAARLRLENLKLALRALRSGRSDEAAALLARLPARSGFGPDLAAAKTPQALLAGLPPGVFKASAAAVCSGEQPDIFICEAGLERDYLLELYARAGALAGADRQRALEVCALESALYNFLLVLRGRFFYGFEAGDLAGLLAPGPGLHKFRKMLAADNLGELRDLAAGLALGPGAAVTEPGAMEEQAWLRYGRQAERVFRRGHMGFGTAAAWLLLRRCEHAAVLSAAEGLRLGLSAGELARRLAPEAAGV